MKKNIEELVGEVLLELEIYGLTPSTIYQYKRGFYGPIIKFFNSTNSGNYSKESFEACMEKYENLYASEKIKRHHYQSMKRSLEYIRDYALFGRVDFTRKVDTRKYKPSVEALDIIEGALAATDLKEGFKYSLHVCMRHFFCHIESQGIRVENISKDAIKSFLVSAWNTNRGSMDYIVYSLKVLITHLNVSGISDVRMDLEYFIPKAPPQRIIPAFTMEEIDKILECIDCSTLLGKRNYAIILLASATGLRGIDIINLELEDIGWKTGEISIFQSKTGNPINITVNGQVLNALSDYILHARPRSKSSNVFIRGIAPYTALSGTVTLDKVLDDLCIKAGIEKKGHRSFHSLRRSFATWLASEEVPITTISQMLGHKSIDSDKPYLSFNRNQIAMCAMGFEDIPVKEGVYA